MAADALKCDIAQIAKSIVFANEKAIVVVISGDRKVDEKKLSKVLGHKVSIANADEVKKLTGYVIGGVPPFPHNDKVNVVLDSSLKRFKEVWTAAGTPNSVFKISIEDLKKTVGSDFIDVSK
ncbi:YbaK/EbsC family protein [Candidatus Bathyarchaeota archaeon]|nr:YbaK/EbsC family protein [Candidatus Bathyarchaeota archaeon]MBS7631031.1 YbaK/EbsC family protein [Candidatus Bathyarchaeota archaeon]